ncbi:GRAS family transcription factor [Melia azedarach]|uniref:GRAS family transcription factor n=1 Tax=Melia azedarach TaxID=155640 RepID=A0ACC1YQ03_MELAZ|nr:GRAS family transcription factor [Melia azedarach]
MLGSLNTSSSHDQEEEDPSSSDLKYQQIIHPHPSHSRAGLMNSTAIHMRQLLISCAELVAQSDFAAAHRLISILSANSSPYGDSIERLVHQFIRALSFLLNRHHANASLLMMNISNATTTTTALTTAGTANFISNDSSSLQTCYLSLNQITPFLRFSHLTANQAILESIEVGQQAIHILDFDIMHGVQWPPLMQALAERSNNSLQPPPMLRITGTGRDLEMLRRTGDRLLMFAQTLGLRFQFHPLLLDDDPTSAALYLPSALTLLPNETLAVNCMLYLHRLLRDDTRDLRLFLHKIKALNPKVVTIAEREASHNHPVFLQRFVEAVDHYTAIFDSLEATLPPNSRERLAVEQIWFGREIVEIVAAEGDDRRERHERYESWEMILRSSGFSNVPLSAYSLSQAKLLLRLHYPSEGYQLQILNNSFFLGWQNRALFSVSSWH